MIINYISDLINYIDNGDYQVDNPWDEVLHATACYIKNHANSPNYGEDWTEFLNSINILDIIMQVDDDLTEMKEILKNHDEYDEIS